MKIDYLISNAEINIIQGHFMPLNHKENVVCNSSLFSNSLYKH
jgi:hypothetical protein